MMAGVLDQAANPPPVAPEGEALVDLDFVNGIYLVEGSPVALSTVLDYNTDFIQTGIGLWIYEYLWDYDIDDEVDNPVPEFGGAALAALLNGNFTIAVEWATYTFNFAEVVQIADSAASPGKRMAIEDSQGNYFLAYDWLQPVALAVERDLTKDSDTPDSLQTGIHAIALTRTNDHISCSIDGGIVKTVVVEQFGFSEIPLTHAWIGGDNNVSYGDMVVGRFRIFTTPLPDENLTALSTVTELVGPANDNFIDATEVFVDTPVTGYTFGSTAETDEPTNVGTQHTTVWYKFTALATTSYTISLAGSDVQGAGNYGWLICVYTLADEYEIITDLVPFDDASDYPDAPTLVISATSGTTYYIRIGGYGGGYGYINLEITT